MVEAVSDSKEPAQSGPLFPATGADGVAFMVTWVDAGALLHPLTIAITL